MKLGYNTNGLAFHRWTDAIELLADLGYRAVGITVDQHCLDPWSPRFEDDLAQMRELLDRFRLDSVVETGARFLLNPRLKHDPTLLSPAPDERQLRLDFFKRCVDIAARLDSDAVSFWSGALREDVSAEQAWQRLAAGCREIIEYAGARGVTLAFEPEPGMFVETLADFERLLDYVDAPHFGLTIDVGHVHCLNEGPIPEHLRRWTEKLANVHIEDMRRGVHEHLRFGEGEIEFFPVLSALQEIGYAGGVYVELSRHSHVAVDAARESHAFLAGLLEEIEAGRRA